MSRVGSSPVTCTKTSRRNTACFFIVDTFKNAVAELHEIFDFVEAEMLGVSADRERYLQVLVTHESCGFKSRHLRPK